MSARVDDAAVAPDGAAPAGTRVAPAERVIRHHKAARVYHWSMAASVFVLLATGFLPLVGIQFAWVTIHWIAGVVLLVLVLYHIVRSLRRGRWRAMWIGRRDFGAAAASARWALGGPAPPRPGKYQPSQKAFHHVAALMLLVTLVTGVMMMTRIDSQLWTRNPHWLSDSTWGLVYVLHGLAALATITLVMLHVYIALRPEKLWITRSMFLGWIPRQHYREHHDAQKWRPDE